MIWRGEIYDVDLGQPVGHEPAFAWPAAVVSTKRYLTLRKPRFSWPATVSVAYLHGSLREPRATGASLRRSAAGEPQEPVALRGRWPVELLGDAAVPLALGCQEGWFR